MTMTDITTGTEFLRAALRARTRKGHYLSILARELSISVLALESFATGSGRLPDDLMIKLAKDMFPHSISTRSPIECVPPM